MPPKKPRKRKLPKIVQFPKEGRKYRKQSYDEVIPKDTVRIIQRFLDYYADVLETGFSKFQRWCRNSVETIGSDKSVVLSDFYTRPPTVLREMINKMVVASGCSGEQVRNMSEVDLIAYIMNPSREIQETAAGMRDLESFRKSNWKQITGERGGGIMNEISMAWYGLPLAYFYRKAKEKMDLGSFFKVLKIDPTLLREPWASEKFDKARLSSDFMFLNKFVAAVVPIPRKRLVTNSKILLIMGCLMQKNLLDQLSQAQLTDFIVCNDFVEISEKALRAYVDTMKKEFEENKDLLASFYC